MDKHQSPITSHQSLFRTKVTELFGIRLPVIASGLMWLANADYIGAAVNAGLMAYIPRLHGAGIWAHRSYKERLVAADETNTALHIEEETGTARIKAAG